ncbi:hypothetical protein FJY63_02520 [Candidatus Sumerlaeota bacterium]|nr:hypothetical protein [Candidatus Sumerlaeota bacterium]
MRLCKAALMFALIGSAWVGASPCAAQVEQFDFLKTTGTLGFDWRRDVELRFEPGKGLLALSRGNDPHFISRSLSLPAARSGELIVRAAFGGPVRILGLYFATDKLPQTGEDKVLRIPVRPDGEERDYRFAVGQHPLWRGKITRLRFDLEGDGRPGATMRLLSISYTYQTEPRLNVFRCAASVVKPGATAGIEVGIENLSPDSATDLTVRFESTSDAISVSPAQIAVALKNDEQTSLAAVVLAQREAATVLDAVLLRRDAEIDRRNIALCVANDGPSPEAIEYRRGRRRSEEYRRGRRRSDDETWALVASPSGQALVVAIGRQSGLAEWWAPDGNGQIRVGRIFPLVSLLHGEQARRLEIVRWRKPEKAAADSSPANRLNLTGDLGPPGREIAQVQFEANASGEDGQPISVAVTLEAKRTIHLRAFTSPRMLVGDGGFGDDRDEALFPGLEYLEKGEQSSSKLDYHTPEYLRTVPHPRKITFPLMALTHKDRLLMLQWPYPKPQGDGLAAPSAGFASPNFVDGQRNHLMTLFWPSVPDAAPENGWEARNPVLIEAGDRLSLEYKLYAMRSLHVSDAIPLALRSLVGPAELPIGPPPRDHEAERALCRTAYTEVVWRDEKHGWNHALPSDGKQWPAAPYAFNSLFLESELAEMTSGPERNQIRRIADAAAAHRSSQSGKRPSADDYYFAGEWIVGCVEAREAAARSLIRRQRADGSWGFEPRDSARAELGRLGQAEIGIVADRAIPILQYALMTGQSEAEAAAIKALEHMKQYRIPRAAQVWEIPLHTPDIMGAARAATAYRLGFLLTGSRDYLDRSRYWLNTGLPFVYFWGHPRWPYWQYATTPVFGATHYRAPNWVGLPVQWCGLVYAEEALRYAQLRNDRFFESVAKGILDSAMWQQVTEGEYRGLLPDSYPFASSSGNGPFINPETILRSLWLVRGYDFRANSVVLARGDDRSLRLTAQARLTTASVSGDQSVRARLCAVRDLGFGVFVCGLTKAPVEVVWRGRPVPSKDKLRRDQEGWLYLPDRRWLVINLVGTGEEGDLAIRADTD